LPRPRNRLPKEQTVSPIGTAVAFQPGRGTIVPVSTAESLAIRAGYDRWALVYDHDANPLPALEEPVVREAVGDVRGVTALDLGCGTGRHALWLAAAGAIVTAIDFSDNMLAEARRKPGAAAVEFLSHDLHERLPFPAGRFDLVVSGLVLEHLRDLGGFFGEARRVLRTEGRAVVSAMHPAMFLRGSQARFTDPASGEVVQPGSFPHRMGDFVMAALRAGFRLDDVGEHAPDAAFAAAYPRAAKYVGWPMLVVLRLHCVDGSSGMGGNR
jgi:malonyl-CoA O-methyltransferase